MSAAFSASAKEIAWRWDSGLPKVTRCAACSAASSCARRASPTQVIATAIRLGVRKPPKATCRPLPSSPSVSVTGTGARSKTRCAWSVPRHAERLAHVLDLDVRRVAVDQQRDRPLGAFRPRQPREEQPAVAADPEGDQVLLAGEVVGVALALDLAAQVGAGPGGRLGQREGDGEVAGHRGHHVVAPLLLGRELVDRAPDPVGDVDDHPQRRVRHREELQQLEVAREGDAAAAVLGRPGEREVAALLQLGPQLRRHRPLGLDPPRPLLALVRDVGGDLRLQLLEARLVEGLGQGDRGLRGHRTGSLSVGCGSSGRSPFARSRRTNFWIFPLGVRGISSRISTRSGQ